MRKTLLGALAALLSLLPAAGALGASLGPFDPPGREEHGFRWGEGFQTRHDGYFSSPLADRSAWRNRAYVYGEYGGYDWSVSLRGGASTFTSSGAVEWDPFPYLGASGKVLIWSEPGGDWSVGATAVLDQAFPFETGGSRPAWISGLYDATAALGIQKRLDDRRIAYGGPFYGMGGFKASPRYAVLDNNVPVRPGGAYYKMKDHVGLHGGVAWTLPGIDLLAEGQLTPGGVAAGVSFRLPLEGGPGALVPRSLRELFRWKEDRPVEEKDGWLRGPVRDDGPAKIPPGGEEGR